MGLNCYRDQNAESNLDASEISKLTHPGRNKEPRGNHPSEAAGKGLRTCDPARGRWFVNPRGPWRIYSDSSAVAEAAILEPDGVIVEDVAQIISDFPQINLHELNAALAGVKLLSEYVASGDDALDVELLVDSTCVMGWLKFMAADKPLPKSRSMFFISVPNQIKAIKEILQDMNVNLKAPPGCPDDC